MSTATAETTTETTDAPTEATEPEATEAKAEAILVEIPLQQLRTNPLNLRRRVGDIKALTSRSPRSASSCP